MAAGTFLLHELDDKPEALENGQKRDENNAWNGTLPSIASWYCLHPDDICCTLYEINVLAQRFRLMSREQSLVWHEWASKYFQDHDSRSLSHKRRKNICGKRLSFLTCQERVSPSGWHGEFPHLPLPGGQRSLPWHCRCHGSQFHSPRHHRPGPSASWKPC